jgi:hypothetical protein
MLQRIKFHWESHTANSFAPSYSLVQRKYDAVSQDPMNRLLRVLFQRKADDVWRVIVGHDESRFVPFYDLPEDVRGNLAFALVKYPNDPRPWFQLSEIEAMPPEVRNRQASIMVAKSVPHSWENTTEDRLVFEGIGWRCNVDYYCVVVKVRDVLTIRGINNGDTRIESEGESEADTC